MERNRLEILRAVLERGGYRKAAEALALSPSTLRRQLRLLEAEVGEPVVALVGRKPRVTAAGERLLALGQIREGGQQPGGVLRVGAVATILVTFLRPVLERFAARQPKVEVHLVSAPERDLFRDLAQGSLDLGVLFSVPGFDSDSDRGALTEELLYEEEFVLALSPRHPLSGRKTIRPRDLNELALLAHSPANSLRRYLDHRLQQAGVRPRILMELDSFETIVRMLQNGPSAAFLPLGRVTADHLAWVRVEGFELRCPVAVVYSRSARCTVAARDFAALCRECAPAVTTLA